MGAFVRRRARVDRILSGRPESESGDIIMASILFIEPAPIIREPLAALMSHEGHVVHVAEDGVQATQMLSTLKPTMIIMELSLAKLDGWKFIENLRATGAGARMPVFVLTSVTDREQLKRAVAFNVSGFMLKQKFSLATLMQQIATALVPTAAPSSHEERAAAEPSADTNATAASVPAPAREPVSKAPASPPASFNSGATTMKRIAGDALQALSAVKPIILRSELQQALDAVGEVKALSPTVAHLLTVTASSGCSIDRVVDAVKMDHALALKMLKLANSSVYSRGDSVDSIKTAVMRIGVAEIRQAVMNIAIMEAFSLPELNTAIDCNQFWEHSIATGLISAEIARKMERKDVDTAFTVGLLHDVGRMIFAEHLGERYVRVLETAKDLQLPLELVEKRMLLMDHAEIMVRVLHAWRFPKHLVNPIVFHHLPAAQMRKTIPRELNECATLALANRLAHVLMLGSSGNHAIYGTSELLEILKLDESFLRQIEEEIPEQTNQMKFSMLATSSMDAWPQIRASYRGKLAQPLRPMYLCAKPGVDSVSILLQRLLEGGDSERPNLAIVKINNASEIRVLSPQFLEEEAKANVGKLPILILSPAGKFELESSIMADHRTLNLPFPLSIDSLFGAINEMLGSAAPAQSRKAAA